MTFPKAHEADIALLLEGTFPYVSGGVSSWVNPVSYTHLLLRLSHDRLEQDLIGRPMAMRDALSTLHSLIRDEPGAAASPLPGAQGLLRLLAQYCQLEIATIHSAADGEIKACLLYTSRCV